MICKQIFKKILWFWFLSDSFHYSCNLKTLPYHFGFVSEVVVQVNKPAGVNRLHYR